MKPATLVLATAGVSQAFMPSSRPTWVGRNVAAKADFAGGIMPETPAVYESETKKMLGAMEEYIKGAEEIAKAGSDDLSTDFATIPNVPEMVRELFGDKSEAYKVATSGVDGADIISAEGAVSDVADAVGFSSEYSADFCDVSIWWRAPEVVKARWGADSKAYKMAQAAADQIAEQATTAQLDADWDALYEFENSYVGGVPTLGADAAKGLGEEERAMFAAVEEFKSPAPTLSDEELSAEFEPEWATRMKAEDDEMFAKLSEKLGGATDFDTEKWDDSDPLGKIKEAFGADSQTFKDAEANMAAFATPPTQAEFDESLKALLGASSEGYKAAQKMMKKPAAKKEEPAEAKPAKSKK